MWCLACEQFSSLQLCIRCLGNLERAPHTVTRSGLVVRPAFVHEGAARTLVTKLKYQGLADIADLFARELVAHVPTEALLLVPIPRVLVRKVRYGSDPAVLLAKCLGVRTGLPVSEVLMAPVWTRRSTSRSIEGRQNRSFRAKNEVRGWVLVDDVMTTGGTLSAAARALGEPGLGAVTATFALKQ